MRGLTVIVAGADPARLRTALGLVAAQAALGARARLFLDAPAVALLGKPDPGDDAAAAAGLPRRDELIDTCRELGATLILCQSGLALFGLDLATLGPGFEGGGLTALLASLADDHLVAI